MTVGELIEELSKFDPDLPVCDQDNRDIYFLTKLEWYWDGMLQRLILDKSKKPWYHVKGIKIGAKGFKVKINFMDWEDVIENDVDAEVDLSDLTEHSRKEWQNRIDNWREEVKEIHREVEENISNRMLKKNKE